MAAKRQLKRSKSFEFFMIDRFFYIIRHRTKRKVSFYFYGGNRIKLNRRLGRPVGVRYPSRPLDMRDDAILYPPR
jgi:hypothetical protein